MLHFHLLLLLGRKYFMVFHSRISFGRTLEFFQRRPNEHERKTTAERQEKQEAKRGISNNHNNNNTES